MTIDRESSMRVLIIPLAAVVLVFGSASDEPTEHQMRGAFESSLAAKVRGALEFVAETGGPEAVDKVRQNGTDRFYINAVEKRECARYADGLGHVCTFTIQIDLVNGALRGTMTGRFFTAPGGLAFTPAA